jgi:hypothetical protein
MMPLEGFKYKHLILFTISCDPRHVAAPGQVSVTALSVLSVLSVLRMPAAHSANPAPGGDPGFRLRS